VKLWDSEGKEYLDFLGGLAVTSLGHAHPAVADALADQARTLLHVSNLYFNEWQPQVAERLDALHGGGGKVFFANSGAEANECAIKLARRYGQANGGPDRFHVLSAWGSFHGRTLTTLAATGQPQKQETFQPLPEGFRQVVFADLDALAAAMDERVCAECNRHPPATSKASGRCATSARRSWSWTRCRPGSAAPASGSATSTRKACGPTS
jgi:acetylornithine/succinyldiaminopimelate/putrescine aminotransferase